MSRLESDTKRRSLLQKNLIITDYQVRQAGAEIKRERQRQAQLENFAKLRSAEILAQEIIDQIPEGTKFTITRRNQDEMGESEYQIFIKTKNDKKVQITSTDKTISESRNHVSFCIETRLLLRDNQNNFTRNDEKINEILSQRQQAA